MSLKKFAHLAGEAIYMAHFSEIPKFQQLQQGACEHASALPFGVRGAPQRRPPRRAPDSPPRSRRAAAGSGRREAERGTACPVHARPGLNSRGFAFSPGGLSRARAGQPAGARDASGSTAMSSWPRPPQSGPQSRSPRRPAQMNDARAHGQATAPRGASPTLEK